jgi:hypothetical protein
VSSTRAPWLVVGAVGVALVAALFLMARPAAARHPDPRAGITAEKVLPPELVPHTPGALEAYVAARTAPATLDGLYCHCDCSKHAGHRSLLTCFESEHGGHCDICMGEARLAAQLAARGTSLAAIRAAIDAQFGS